MSEIASPAVLVSNQGPIRILSINRPERRNSLNLDDRRELIDEIKNAGEDATCRVIILTGEGKVFCAGGDISTMTADEDVARVRLALANELAMCITNSAKPIVAAVRGGAFGLGLAVAQACDFVVAADDAKFTASFAKLGLGSDTGLAWSLAQRVGMSKAKQLILLAREVSAVEALENGMVDELAASESVVAAAIELATKLSKFSVPMMAATKELFAQQQFSLEAVLHSEMEAQIELLGGEDFTEGRAAFFEKRAANFQA
jgi:2-(1,2-epoxy-1,2-dihydrophenyl)acetyl-CoA isomerase